MADGILYYLNLNLFTYFRAGSRSPVTFKTKFYVTIVTNMFQPLTIFRHKELHLRCCIELELNIVTWLTRCTPPLSWLSVTFGKYKLTHTLLERCLKDLCIIFSIFSKGTQCLDFIKHNIIQKLAHKVKCISVKCIIDSTDNNVERINTRKRNAIHIVPYSKC